MKRYFALILALMMLFQTGCGGESKTPLPTDSSVAQESGGSQSTEGNGPILTLQDPGAFLDRTEPDTEGKNDEGFFYKGYFLTPEEDVLALQYAELLQSGAYRLEKPKLTTDENDTSQVWTYYFRYAGEEDIPILEIGDEQCNIFVGVRRDHGDKTLFAVYYPEEVGFADWGARADQSAVPPPTADSLESAPTPDQASDSAVRVVRYMSPSAFLHDQKPNTDREIGNGATEQVFVLKKGMGALGRQYVNVLTSDLYEFKLIDTDETTAGKATFEYYYLQYSGGKAVGTITVNGTTCNLCVRVTNYENRDETHIQVLAADRFQPLDTGERADTTALNTAKPTSAVSEQPTPTEKPNSTGPEVIPDFLENDISGAFRAGNSAFDHAVCFLANDTTYYSAAEAYVQLLIDLGYTLSDTEEKSMRTWSRMQWDLYYEGKDWATIDDNSHVRVKHLARDRDGERKTEISITYSEDITYGGDEQFKGGGGGGTSGGSWDPNLPDHSKLQCLTCDGSGDCPSCGGYGEKTRAGITKDCTRCDRGDCPTCHGSGTR